MHIRPCALDSNLTFLSAKSLSVNFSEARSLPERTTSVSLEVEGPISNWRTDFLFDYDIFPRSIMRHATEWRDEGRKMLVGDIIIQRAVMPPIGIGLCLVFAVRICALIEESGKRGFAYETLAGHAESGVSEFYFEERFGKIFFTIHTFSQPSHWTARIAKHFFTLPYQAWCTRRALAHVRKRFIEENEKNRG
jgi:hypothetical protein